MSDRDPDGFVIVHTPKDGGDQYGLGPFPPFDELAEKILADPTCDCVLTVLWIGFPKGVRMAVAVEGDDIDIDAVVEQVTEIITEAIQSRKEAANDRLN